MRTRNGEMLLGMWFTVQSLAWIGIAMNAASNLERNPLASLGFGIAHGLLFLCAWFAYLTFRDMGYTILLVDHEREKRYFFAAFGAAVGSATCCALGLMVSVRMAVSCGIYGAFGFGLGFYLLMLAAQSQVAGNGRHILTSFLLRRPVLALAAALTTAFVGQLFLPDDYWVVGIWSMIVGWIVIAPYLGPAN